MELYVYGAFVVLLIAVLCVAMARRDVQIRALALKVLDLQAELENTDQAISSLKVDLISEEVKAQYLQMERDVLVDALGGLLWVASEWHEDCDPNDPTCQAFDAGMKAMAGDAP